VVTVHERAGEAASQIRAVRARLLAMPGAPRVIVITSATREEGKSTMAMNLAVALGEVDPGRIVLVDGDVHAPKVPALAGIDAISGLDDILRDGLDLNDNVYETSVPRVDIIPARSDEIADDRNGPPDQQGLLARHCAPLFAKLRTLYSFVIVDTPPVLASPEACMFGRHSDGVILIARLEKTSREAVKRAADELTKSGATVIGCVLTDRKHHVPDFIYRMFFGRTSGYYYYHYRRKGTPAARRSDSGTGLVKK
jgi:receptor protein-tyrosine kinase